MVQRDAIEISGDTSKILPLELQNVQIQEEWELCICTTIDDFKKSKRNTFLVSFGIFYSTQTQINFLPTTGMFILIGLFIIVAILLFARHDYIFFGIAILVVGFFVAIILKIYGVRRIDQNFVIRMKQRYVSTHNKHTNICTDVNK
jgi:hypothetical protein